MRGGREHRDPARRRGLDGPPPAGESAGGELIRVRGQERQVGGREAIAGGLGLVPVPGAAAAAAAREIRVPGRGLLRYRPANGR